MSESSDLRPKSDAAIQVRVRGQDVRGQRFDEVGTAFPTSKGVMLETIHQLREGTALELTETVTGRKAIVSVKSAGPNLGVSSLVFLEGLDLDNLWITPAAREARARQMDPPGSYLTSTTSGDSSTDIVASQRALMQTSKPVLPNLDRLMATLGELVESALEANLRPAMEQLTSEIPAHVLKTRSEIFANLEEQMQASVGAFGDRLKARADELVERTETVLGEKTRECTEENLRLIAARQDEFSRYLERVLSESFQQLHRQLDDLNVSERLSEKVHAIFGGFCAELEGHCQRALATAVSDVERTLQEAANRLGERVKEAESAIAQEKDGIARSLGELRELHDQINRKEESLIEHTEQMQKEAVRQNRDRVAWMLRELGEHLVKFGNS